MKFLLLLPLALLPSVNAWAASSVLRGKTRGATERRGFFDDIFSGGGEAAIEYVPDGMSKTDYERSKAETASKAKANKARKRGSAQTLEQALKSGVKHTVQLKGAAVEKAPKKNWLNPFADE